LFGKYYTYRKWWGMGRKDGMLIGPQQKRIFSWSRIITIDNQKTGDGNNFPMKVKC
jgi:hypothetical protein